MPVFHSVSGGPPKELQCKHAFFDLGQMPNLPTDRAMYPLMFPDNVHAQLFESDEWALYKASLVEDPCDFDIHSFTSGGGMKERAHHMPICNPNPVHSAHLF